VKVLSGIDGINFIAAHENTNYVINALMGQIGLLPTLNALRAGKSVGLANKETLVAAGEIVMQAARENHARILPVDSEHCAVFQCIQGENLNEVEKIILTASGGPFYGKSREDLERVTVADALKHPTWSMGKKITVDSATMMNKGLELIEACWLFAVAPENIEIIIHKESIIHSLVQFIDKSVKAQLSVPNMKMCIQYALTFSVSMHNKNKRSKCKAEELNLAQIGSLNFAEPDDKTFIFPELCRFAIKESGTLPAVMNAANEAAVDLFLKEKIKFTDIFNIVEQAVFQHGNTKNPGVNDILDCIEETNNKIKRHFI
jgi:1-deoxy-D-xylulose-5-phosphate reductoisomerase